MRIVVINLALICAGVLVLEAGYRCSKYLASCATQCNGGVFHLVPISGNHNIGLTVFDPVLGFVPRPHFDSIIDQPNWNRSRVTITADGHRSNNDQTTARPFAALAIGDSFTFGNQVSNPDTWPSCLEREGKFSIANAGVPGYGAAQSVLRGKIELEKYPQTDLIIWSILVDEDFSRDRLKVHSGFIKPAVIVLQGKVVFSAPPSNDGAINRQFYEPAASGPIAPLLWISRHFYLADALSGYLGWNERVDIQHTQAASIEQIIDFAFDEFSRLPVARKLVLLQYSKRGASLAGSKEHQLLVRAAQSRGLPLLDSKQVVKQGKADEVWDGHHTPFGNKLICRGILESLH